MNRLVLIDGNAMMHRAYHALPPLTSPDGKPVHVVYGFLSMVMRLFADLKPTHMAIAFDRPGPTFRNKLFEKYQIQRPKMEDDFISQILLVHEAVTSFGIPLYERDGFEADDMIGTICAQRAKSHIDEIIIVTGDRDMLQLVEDEKVLVFMPTKGLSEGKLYGEKEVVERMGVAPKMIVDLKALMGDSSDNYPGVSGIGPKTAISLLREFGSLERIYKALDTGIMNAAVKSKLVHGKDSALLGKTLATIRQDAPITFDEKCARIATLNTPSAQKTLEAYHFTSLLKRLHAGSRNETKQAEFQEQQKKAESDQQQLF